MHKNNNYEGAEELKDFLIWFLIASVAADDKALNIKFKKLRTAVISKLKSNRQLIPKSILSNRDLNQFDHYMIASFSTLGERRHFIWKDFEALLEYYESTNLPNSLTDVDDVISDINIERVYNYWAKAKGRMLSDPEGAITASKTFLEWVCKYILGTQQIDYSGMDLPILSKKAINSIIINKDEKKSVIKILGGCLSIISGIGELRNAFGDCHAPNNLIEHGISPITSELVVNACGYMAVFLIKSFKLNIIQGN